MGFLYPHHPRDRRAPYAASSWDDDDARLPARPAPAMTIDPLDDIETYSRRDARPDRSRRRGREAGEPRKKRVRTESQERRRERRRAQDPEREAEREARREERRQAKRAERRAERERTRYQGGVDAEESTPRASKRSLPSTPTSEFADEAAYLPPDGHRDGRQSQSPRRTRQPRNSPPRMESWTSTEDGWHVDLESSHHDEKYGRRSRPGSMFDELDFYKRTAMPDHAAMRRGDRRCCCCAGGEWSRRRKWVIFSLLALSIITFIAIVAGAVASSRNHYSYTPSTAQVNNTAAFTSGGATRNNVNDTKDGIGAGADAYHYYSGNASNFPAASLWVSFEDMWNNNLPTLQQSCSWLGVGTDNSPQEIDDIRTAIQDRANVSLVDHRLIFALVLQESHGCVRINATTSSGGVRNPGLMQSHNGHSYDPHHSQTSITAMVQDGTQGTSDKVGGGEGLVQLLNTYGNPYSAARGYNSGYVPTSGNLSEAAGATACYVSDIANRLTGWVNAQSTCPGA